MDPKDLIKHIRRALMAISYRLKLFYIIMNHERLPGLIEKLRNLKKRVSRESCLQMKTRIDRIPNIRSEIASLKNELETFINRNIEKGLIRRDEVHLKIGDLKGKKVVSDFDDNLYIREIRKKYRRFQWAFLALRHPADEDFFQDIKDYQRKIQKAKEDLRKVNSLEERQEIEKFMVFQQIAMVDLKLTILVVSQIYLVQEIQREPEVHHEFIQCVLGIESILGLRLNINTLFSEQP